MSIKVCHIPGTAAWYDCKKLEENQYLTHHNGGRPYRVIIGKETTVIDNSTGETLITVIPTKVWIGESPVTPMTEFSGGHGDKFIGNSILLFIDNYYIFIGHKIFSFVTNHNIINYVSEVGNSDVPYPYAIDTENNFYLMLENTMLQVPEKYHKDPYKYYYTINNNNYQTIINVKEFIAYKNGTTGEKEIYNVSYTDNPKQMYSWPWMKNLHAVDKTTGEIYPVSEKDYIAMMQLIADTYQYKNMNIKLIHEH